MFKNKLKKIFLILIGTSIISLDINICSASGIISKNSYTLPMGKDVLMNHTSSPNRNLYWSSENTRVATVDSWGIVHAKSLGKTKITATDKRNGKKSTCLLNVCENEPFKNVITSSNISTTNESFEIKAYAAKNVESVRFDVHAPGYKNTYQCSKKKNDKDCCVWSQSVKIPKCGDCKIEAFGKIKGTWKSCSEARCDIYISNNYKKSESTFSEKRASPKASDFIISCEGFVNKVYKDCAGILTIGCGKRVYPFEPFYNNLTREEGIALFSKTLNQGAYTGAVNRFLKKHKIKCNQHQFDALVSFSYNLGCAWMNNGSELSRILTNCGGNSANNLRAIVNSKNGIWVRSAPNTSSNRLYALANNSKVDLVSGHREHRNWYRIKLHNGGVGYCCADYLKVYSEKSGEKSLSNINKNKFISEFSQYHHTNKKCCKGLIKRRFEELDIFFRGFYSRKSGWRGAGNYPIPRCASKLF